MVRVLVVEDSPVARELLLYILSADPEIEIAGVAENGETAVDAAARLQPSVITMDIHMPRMNGVAATRRIMETAPCPIVIVSGSVDRLEVATTFGALAAGALAAVARPVGMGHPMFEQMSAELVQTVKLMSEVKVVRRFPRYRDADDGDRRIGERHPDDLADARPVGIVAIGASTGGPQAIQTILNGLPKRMPVPVVIVQHMASGFIHGFVDWLAATTGHLVRVASHAEVLVKGGIYVAPDDAMMTVDRDARVTITTVGAGSTGVLNTVDTLFRSVGESFAGRAIAVLLTGMGVDGARGLLDLRRRGAITVAQDERSSVVHGMPGEAIRLGAVSRVLTPPEIAAYVADVLTSVGAVKEGRAGGKAQ